MEYELNVYFRSEEGDGGYLNRSERMSPQKPWRLIGIIIHVVCEVPAEYGGDGGAGHAGYDGDVVADGIEVW